MNANPKGLKPMRAGQRGVALILVLWIFIFLFVVAFNFTASVRENALAAHRYGDDTEGYYLALAGFHQGLYDLLHYKSGPGGLSGGDGEDLFDGSWREKLLAPGRYQVRCVDEGGKVNLNRASEEVLRRIFLNLDVEEPLRSVLVDSILDWRDEDKLHRTSGAEDDYYRSLSPPHTARNGPFTTVDELLWVKGVTADLFYGRGNDSGQCGLKEIFTVDSTMDRVNFRTFSPCVCHALLGVSRERCEELVAERKTLSEKTLGDLIQILGLPPGDVRQLVSVDPTVVSIEAGGRVAGADSWRQVKGVIRVAGGNFELIRWLDRDPGPRVAERN